MEIRGVEPVHSLRLRGHLMGVVDKEQWSAGEASAIAEVALAINYPSRFSDSLKRSNLPF